MTLAQGGSAEQALQKLDEDYPSAGGIAQIKILIEYCLAHHWPIVRSYLPAIVEGVDSALPGMTKVADSGRFWREK